MNTKLNMGVIEDKSITYSKLADDVAESITATMTGSAPDWNAQEGEAGYIKNRTHGIILYSKPEDVNFNDLLLGLKNKTPEIIIEDSFTKATYKQVNEFAKLFNNFKFFKKELEGIDDYVSRFSDTFEIFGGSGQVKIYYDDYEDLCITIQFPTENFTNINEILTVIDEYYYIIQRSSFEVHLLNSSYLPDKVIKTTPQVLSDNAKNQVKENLGISASDWNSQEGQTGYIKNRTHYVYGGDYIFWGKLTEGELVDSTYYFDVYDHTRVCLSVRGRTAYDVEQLLISLRVFDTQTFTTENGYLFTVTLQFDPDSDSYKLAITPEDDIFDWHNEMDILILDTETHISKLSEAFIPDSIARRSDFKTINGQSITEGGNIDLVADGDEVSNLILKPGCKIGSFIVDYSNNLSSNDEQHVLIANDGISISSDDYASFTDITCFGSKIVSEHENMPAMSIIAPNGIEIADPLRNQTVGYAIKAHDGMFAGLRPWVRVIDSSSSSSDKTLTALDHTILIYSSSAQTITLPTNPKDGQEYTIMLSLTNTTSVKHIISSSSTNIFIPKEGNLKSSLSVDAHGYIKLIYVKDTGFWWYYRIA